MRSRKNKSTAGKVLGPLKGTLPYCPEVSSEDIDKAMADFQRRGGKIKKIELDWIEDGDPITVN